MNFVKALAVVVTVAVAAAGAATDRDRRRRRRLCVVACGHKPLSKFSERDCTHGKRQLFVSPPFLHFRHHMERDRKATGVTFSVEPTRHTRKGVGEGERGDGETSYQNDSK